MILLDTNVASEAMKPDPDPPFRHWLDNQLEETLFLSSITIAELSFGVGIMPAGRRKEQLSIAIERLLGLFSERIIAFDESAARRYGALAALAKGAGRGFPLPDAYIAAIAASRGFAVATRDASAFAAAGLAVIDPWSPR
jgi:predicted nucleic acid-binding protein